MEHNSCVLCQLAVTSNNKIDIQLTATKIGQVNVEEFLKKTILEVHANIRLRSNFLCQQCFAAVNTLEDHFIMYKSIQQSLQEKYFKEKILKIKQESTETDANESINCTLTENTSDSSDPSHEETSDNPAESKHEPRKIHKTQLRERKSSRKRKSIPNYIEEDKDKVLSEKKVKKSSSTAIICSDKNKAADDPSFPAKPEYCCEICGKQYVNYNGWNIHRRKHRNENLIRCEYCDKTFTQKIGLRRHLHMHTGTFPFECNICQKKFIHSSSYKIHKQIHEGKRDFICDTCGMAFYSRTHLRSHINRHTKEKLHACNECGATFTEKYNMRAHRLKVHGIKC